MGSVEQGARQERGAPRRQVGWGRWSGCGVAALAIGLGALQPVTTAVGGTNGAASEGVAQSTSSALTEQEALEIGIEAYVYLYPIISMEITRRVSTSVPAGVRPGMGPMNAFHHFRTFPKADFREVVRPNFDTLYSSAWVDLTAGPMIVSAPDTSGRYYLLPMLDMWSNVFASPGKRTSGTGAGRWALVPPGWTGTLPAGVGRIDAPTPHVWIIGRTQTNGPSDYSAVHSVQDEYSIAPLPGGGKVSGDSKPDPSWDLKTSPLVQVNTMTADRYFALGAELMAKHPPQKTDWSTLARLARIGLVPGRPFDLASAPEAVRAGLSRAPQAALAEIKAKVPTVARVVNGWQMNTDTMGVYGNAYLKRAIVSMVGLGANQPEDAIYPLAITDADGESLRGDRRYELRFSKEQLPPVGAFWSVTMYDAEGFQVANPLNRFAIGDRDALKFDADGSLTIYIQHENPGKNKESNWLPSPASGALGVTMRLYAPKAQVIDGRWNPPAIRRVN